MIIDVTGIKTTSLITEIEEAIQFYSYIMFHKNMSKHMQIYIDFNENFVLPGETSAIDQKHRSFEINIRGQEGDDHIIRTIAHEMVHVKQWARGEFYPFFSKDPDWPIEVMWLGKVWRPGVREDPYYDAPWEIEAYGREGTLFQRWNLYKLN